MTVGSPSTDSPKAAFPSVAEPGGRTLGDEEVAAAERVIRSGMLNSVWGTEVRALESELASLYGLRHVVACSSGTSSPARPARPPCTSRSPRSDRIR